MKCGKEKVKEKWWNKKSGLLGIGEVSAALAETAYLGLGPVMCWILVLHFHIHTSNFNIHQNIAV